MKNSLACVLPAQKTKNAETLKEIALADCRNATVLKNFGLDYSFRGKYTLQEACKEQNLSLSDVKYKLYAAIQLPRVYHLRYEEWPADYLVDFIVINHHQYVRKSLLMITELFSHVPVDMQRAYPFILQAGEIFQRIAIAMSAYLVQEEQAIFPYVRFLVQATQSSLPENAVHAGCIKHRIAILEIEQKIVGEDLALIRNLFSNYVLPGGALSVVAALFQALNDFDDDLQQHVHLENNILYPTVMKLEKERLRPFVPAPGLSALVTLPEKTAGTLF
ncbi:MAG: DUF542 domain-containing protein [Chitinophagaceae bacterium]